MGQTAEDLMETMEMEEFTCKVYAKEGERRYFIPWCLSFLPIGKTFDEAGL